MIELISVSMRSDTVVDLIKTISCVLVDEEFCDEPLAGLGSDDTDYLLSKVNELINCQWDSRELEMELEDIAELLTVVEGYTINLINELHGSLMRMQVRAGSVKSICVDTLDGRLTVYLANVTYI